MNFEKAKHLKRKKKVSFNFYEGEKSAIFIDLETMF